MKRTLTVSLFLCALLWACRPMYAESLSICDVPQRLPYNTGLGSYSPYLCFEYSGLGAGKTYTLKVWLLAPGSWYCASSQWCERNIPIDNVAGTNSSGRIQLTESLDVYGYSYFDWVLRLYDAAGYQVAFTEQYTDGTANRAPVLSPIGKRIVVKNQPVQFDVTASDSDGGTVSLSATNLPAGAQFDPASGKFYWQPTTLGDYRNILFKATDNGEGSLADAELVDITVTSCNCSLSSTQGAAGATGGSGSFAVDAETKCGWAAVSSVGWLHSTASGSGKATAAYYFDLNPGTGERVGTITVNGQTFTVNQAGWPAGAWLTDASFGPLYNNGNGWYGSPVFGWLWFSGEWAWSSKLQGWISSGVRNSNRLWSTQLRWLTVSGNNDAYAFNSIFDWVWVGDNGWVWNSRFGWIWAVGDGTWFYSSIYGWLGVTSEGGIWCVSQSRFL